ncbi:MAG: hypothetical protein Kow0062_17400 [Acidobacteriota bacterium]
MIAKRIVWVAAVAAVAALAGCSGSSDPWQEPDATVKILAHDLAAGHPETAWEALPASYREDVQSLLREATERLDGQLWDASFRTLGKLGRVIEEKREFILANPMLQSQKEAIPGLERTLDGMASTLHTLAESDLASFDRLAELDIGEFLATTGVELMAKLRSIPAAEGEESWADSFDKLGRTTVTVLSREDGRAVLRIEVPDEEPREEAWVRVEDRWVPEEIASSWSENISKMRDAIRGAEATDTEEKRQAAMMQLAVVDGVLDQLLATKTAEEFNSKIGAIFGLLMGAMMNQSSTS